MRDRKDRAGVRQQREITEENVKAMQYVKLRIRT